MSFLHHLVGIVVLMIAFHAQGKPSYAEPTLKITAGAQTKIIKRFELLRMPGVTDVTVNADPSYSNRKMKYRAVPVSELFRGISLPEDSTILFRCKDGFAAPIKKSRLLNTSSKGSVAYLAIETEEKKWPSMKTNEWASAGPFYLIWKQPQLSQVSPEEWPYQLEGFEVKSSVRDSYPLILPDPLLPPEHEVYRGFQVFLKNCFACHTFNGQGPSRMGPDLNLPNSPVEYFKKGYLQSLIRNPQNLRHWPQAKMPAFAESTISNSELQSLIGYLTHMSRRKPK